MYLYEKAARGIFCECHCTPTVGETASSPMHRPPSASMPQVGSAVPFAFADASESDGNERERLFFVGERADLDGPPEDLANEEPYSCDRPDPPSMARGAVHLSVSRKPSGTDLAALSRFCLEALRKALRSEGIVRCWCFVRGEVSSRVSSTRMDTPEEQRPRG